MRHVIAGIRGSEDGGFTLVELLVVMVILGVVGTVTVAGITSGLRTTSYAQARVDTLAETQTTLERISREIRAGHPLREITDDRMTLDVCRDGQLRHYRYTVQQAGEHWELVQDRLDFQRGCPDPDFDPGSTTPEQSSTRTLAAQMTDDDVFTALDRDGGELTGTAADNADDVHRVIVRVQRGVQEGRDPIEAETTVTLRNPVGN